MSRERKVHEGKPDDQTGSGSDEQLKENLNPEQSEQSKGQTQVHSFDYRLKVDTAKYEESHTNEDPSPSTTVFQPLSTDDSTVNQTKTNVAHPQSEDAQDEAKQNHDENKEKNAQDKNMDAIEK